MDSSLIESTTELNNKSDPLLSDFRGVKWAKIEPKRTVWSSGENNWETSVLSNSGRYCDLKKGFIMLPVFITVNAPLGFDIEAADKTMNVVGFKNMASYNLIKNYRIMRDNTQIMDETPNWQAHGVYKLHEKLTDLEVKLKGKALHYYPDPADEFTYNSTAGILNSRNSYAFNKRCEYATNTKVINDRNLSGMVADINQYARVSGESYVQYFAEPGSATEGTEANGENPAVPGDPINNIAVYHHTVMVPLEHLPGPFTAANYGLEKGAFYDINMKFNNCSYTYTRAGAGVNATTTLKANSFIGDSVNPTLINTMVNYAEPGDYKVTCNVGTTVIGNNVITATHSETGLLYVPCYEPQPELSNIFLSLGLKSYRFDRIRTHEYNAAANSRIETTVFSNTARVKRVLLCCYLNGAVPSAVSPFNTSPSTVDPSFLENIQCEYGSLNLFPENLNYNFQHYMIEQNGKKGNIMGVSSQITYDAWTSGLYKYYVFDLTKRNVADIDVALNFKFYATNKSNQPYLLRFFYEIEGEITVDMTTGALKSTR